MTKRLGRGLADLIETSSHTHENFVSLPLDQIRPGRYQPRSVIREADLEELKASIKRSGIIEPVIVRPIAHGTYELVAGERRYRAAKQVGLKEIPAIIKVLSDKEALEFSLVENIQRANLNPLEEAQGYAKLIEEFGYTQEEAATAVGRDRATVANILRLLALPEEIRQGLLDEDMTMGHARALLGIVDQTRQLDVYHRIRREKLSVRQTEAIVAQAAGSRRRRARRVDPQLQSLEDQLRQALGTKVALTARRKGGRITIDYFSPEDLARILHALGVVAS